MIERVGDDGIFFAQQRLEKSTIGIEAGGVKNGVFGTEKFGNRRFQPLVQILRATDEPNRCHAESMRVQRILGGLDDLRMIGQTQIVVGAEIQYLAPVLQFDFGRLR